MEFEISAFSFAPQIITNDTNHTYLPTMRMLDTNLIQNLSCYNAQIMNLSEKILLFLVKYDRLDYARTIPYRFKTSARFDRLACRVLSNMSEKAARLLSTHQRTWWSLESMMYMLENCNEDEICRASLIQRFDRHLLEHDRIVEKNFNRYGLMRSLCEDLEY